MQARQHLGHAAAYSAPAAVSGAQGSGMSALTAQAGQHASQAVPYSQADAGGAQEGSQGVLGQLPAEMLSQQLLAQAHGGGVAAILGDAAELQGYPSAVVAAAAAVEAEYGGGQALPQALHQG